jgi:hypothetical protein
MGLDQNEAQTQASIKETVSRPTKSKDGYSKQQDSVDLPVDEGTESGWKNSSRKHSEEGGQWLIGHQYARQDERRYSNQPNGDAAPGKQRGFERKDRQKPIQPKGIKRMSKCLRDFLSWPAK